MSAICDLIIRNGLVFDGIGPGKNIDIAIHDGCITNLGSALKLTADKELDASGLWITPGFIDIHTHYDVEVEIAPALSESVRHGVTTVVMGNCSLSTIYGAPEDLGNIFSRVETLPEELIASWLQSAKEWATPEDYFRHLQDLPLSANVACLLGHSALRVKVMGLARSLKEKATKEEIERMRALTEAALAAGCIGVSVDMVHWHKVNGAFAGRALPSHHAGFDEYAMLADVCRSRDAVFQVTPNPQSIFSFLHILRLSLGLWRAPLRTTILAAVDMDVAPQLWRFYGPFLFLFNRVLGCNIRFQTLAEPFTIFADGCLTPFFEEFSAGVKLNNCKSREERQALWHDPAFCREFATSWRTSYPRAFHRDLERMIILSAPEPGLEGKSFAQAAKDAGKDPLSYFMTLLQLYDHQLRWKGCSANNRGSIRRTLMKHPHILPGFSDAGAHCRNIAFFDSALSVLRESVASGFLPIEKAISRVTSEPACWFNLDTGVLKVGARADLVLLQPDKLKHPIPAAVGVADPILNGQHRLVKRDLDPAVEHVFVQGTEVVRHGEPLKAVPKGVVLCQHNPAGSAKEALERARNRISESQALPAGADYWPVFLLKHQHPGNVAFHILGFILMYAIPVLALSTSKLWLLLFLPLSQVTGLIGHWLYERSPIDPRDGIFSWRAVSSLHLMFFSVLCGRYGHELERARSRTDVIHQAF